MDIQNFPILKVERSGGTVPFWLHENSRENLKNGYEWFYFEFSGKHENQLNSNTEEYHIVLIVSLKDPFQPHCKTHHSKVSKNSNVLKNPKSQKLDAIPGTIYCTIFQNGKTVAYGYNEFQNTHQLLNTWQTYSQMHFTLADHSGNKLFTVGFNWEHATNFTPLSTEEKVDFQKYHEHFWQLLKVGANTNVVVASVPFKTKSTQNLFRRNLFFDVPLFWRLRFKKPISFELKNALVYADHNAGISHIETIQQPWLWWHWVEQSNSNAINWNVGYYFPNLKKGMEVSLAEKETNLKNKVMDLNENKHSIFLRDNALALPAIYKKAKLIEIAPFYSRHALENKNTNNETVLAFGTVERLKPKIIPKPWNLFLMGARKLYVKPNYTYSDVSQLFFKNLAFSICKNSTKKHGKSFYWASFALSSEMKKRAYLVYFLCRLVDDATDILGHHQAASGLLNSIFGKKNKNCDEFQNQKLEHFEEVSHQSELSADEEISLCSLIENSSGMYLQPQFLKPLFQELRAQCEAINLEKWQFKLLLEGQIFDESFRQPENIGQLLDYCDLVAGVVGRMMCSVLDAKLEAGTSENAQAKIVGSKIGGAEAAESLGLAMQLTNIIRDVKEDFNLGRVYIPKSLVGEPKNLTEISEAHLAYLKELSELSAYFYEKALAGLSHIPSRRGRLCVKAMTVLYGGILGKICSQPQSNLSSRFFLTISEKISKTIGLLLSVSPLKLARLNILSYHLRTSVKQNLVKELQSQELVLKHGNNFGWRFWLK